MPRRLTYTPKLGAEICTMIAEGTGLKAACEKLGLNRATVRGWIDNRPEFGLAYERARRHRADHFQDEILEISDKIADCKDPAAVNAARLQVDSRRWLASKLLPERFGDHSRVEMTGANGKDLLPPEQPPIEKIGLFLLGEVHAILRARHPDMPASAPTELRPPATLLSHSPAPAEPEPVRIDTEPVVETEAMRREHRRWTELTGPRNWRVIQ